MNIIILIFSAILLLIILISYISGYRNKSKVINTNQLKSVVMLTKIINLFRKNKDQMPNGYGEYGLEITNPIPVSSIPESYFYLNRLYTQSGSKIAYERIGSMGAPNIKYIIDGYNIFAEGKQISIIYICPYSKVTSLKAPKGFQLL